MRTSGDESVLVMEVAEGSPNTDSLLQSLKIFSYPCFLFSCLDDGTLHLGLFIGTSYRSIHSLMTSPNKG